MSAPTPIDQLRARARQLRHVSAQIGSCRALGLYGLAGTDTWVGPTAQSCYEALVSLRRQLQADQQSLLDAARGLERHADLLGQQPVVMAPVPS